LNLEIFYTLKEAEVLVEQWRHRYNGLRPHSSLGYQVPAPETVVPASARLATLRCASLPEAASLRLH
jgi:transposase InsO family protein